MAVVVKLTQNADKTLWGWSAKGFKKTSEVKPETLDKSDIFSKEYGETKVEPKFASKLEAIKDAKDTLEFNEIPQKEITILPY